MRWENKYLLEFQRLDKLRDAYARGRQFEQLVFSLLRAGHMKVVRNPGAARPRQTDLLAISSKEVFLVETKWQGRLAGSPEVSDLRDRLTRVDPRAVGVLISISGFTKPAFNEVDNRRKHPILLVDRADLEEILSYEPDLVGHLRRKREDFLIRGRASASVLTKKRSRRSKLGGLEAPVSRFRLPDGTEKPWLSGEGHYGHFTFALDLLDIDWVAAGGVGVSLDMSIPVAGVKGLLELLQYLTEVGWGHPDAQWSIEQSGRSWHGFGGTALADALSHWKERYQDLGQPHHTEVLCYYDKCADGFYTLKADIGATARREVWPCDLSFQLRGIPLDPEPFRALASAFKVDATGHWFRPRTEKSVLRTHLDGRTQELSPLALVVQTENPGARRKPLQWVVGIVTANPFKGRRGRGEKAPEHWPSTLEDSDALICSLGSWHFLGDQVRYHMRWCDSAWSSDIQVISPSADWRDTVRRTRSARESRIVVTLPLAKPKAVRRPRS